MQLIKKGKIRGISALVVFLLFNCVASFAGSPLPGRKTQLPGKNVNIHRLTLLKITNFKIATNNTGIWKWEATVKNIGTTTIDGRQIVLQAYSQLLNSSNWQPASGSIVSKSQIKPGQSVVVTNFWTRCCLTDKLKVVLMNRNNKVFDSRMISNLIYNKAKLLPVNIQVKKIYLDKANKQWRVKIVNSSPYTIKVMHQGYLVKKNGNKIPVGGSSFTLNPYSEETSITHYASSAQPGDKLEVHIWTRFHGCKSDKDVNNCGFAVKYYANW